MSLQGEVLEGGITAQAAVWQQVSWQAWVGSSPLLKQGPPQQHQEQLWQRGDESSSEDTSSHSAQ